MSFRGTAPARRGCAAGSSRSPCCPCTAPGPAGRYRRYRTGGAARARQQDGTKKPALVDRRCTWHCSWTVWWAGEPAPRLRPAAPPTCLRSHAHAGRQLRAALQLHLGADLQGSGAGQGARSTAGWAAAGTSSSAVHSICARLGPASTPPLPAHGATPPPPAVPTHSGPPAAASILTCSEGQEMSEPARPAAPPEASTFQTGNAPGGVGYCR